MQKVAEQACLANPHSENCKSFKDVNLLIPYCPCFLNDVGDFLYRSPHNILKHM